MFVRSKQTNCVTVCIVNWNGERFLERCLSALMEQTVKPDEVILVDNASSDRSLEIVKRFPSVLLIALTENTGFAQGNNIAIEAAGKDAEWIVLLNPDAFAEPCWLESLLTTMQFNSSYDMFGSKLVNAADPVILDGVGDSYHLSGLVWRTGHGLPAMASADIECEIFSPCAAAAMYRRSVLCELGGFDEDYFCYVEDVDLGFRFRLAGYRCLYVPKAVVHHVGSGTTGGQHSAFAMYHGHRNLVWTFVKNMPTVLLFLLLPLHILLNLVSLIWFTLRGQSGMIWRAKRDALLGLPKMWRKRQLIQKNRKVSSSDIWWQLNKRIIIKK